MVVPSKVQPYERNNKGNVWARFKDIDKKLNSIWKFLSKMSNLHTYFPVET